jgi:hypothetical protein
LSVYRPTASNKPLDLFKLVIVKYQRILKGQSRHTDNIGYPRLRKTKQKRRSVFEWSPLRQLSLIYWQKNGQHNGQRKKGQKDKINQSINQSIIYNFTFFLNVQAEMVYGVQTLSHNVVSP